MKWSWSAFGTQFEEPSGILELMRDLGEALAGGDPDLCMLGGGNPAPIPEVEALFREQWQTLARDPSRLDAVLGKYDTAQGSPVFLEALAAYLNAKYDWGIGPENIGITNGSQTAFFYLFNLLAGGGKKILLPLSPEYIGYADQGHGPGMFRAVHGRLEETGPHRFKYRMDRAALEIGDDVAAIAVSRPTNPTGNVLTNDEIQTLSDLALAHEIPLLIDNAYGAPFPGILFREVKPVWAPHIILSMSLSKLGLPGVRTGIIVADRPVIEMLTSVNAVAGLANGNVGQALVGPLLGDGRLDALCREAIRPFYAERSQRAAAVWEEALGDSVPWMRHEAEGSMFHWIRFPGLPVKSAELYQILKRKGVLVVPGHFFFYGLDRDPPEKHECLRVHTAMNPEMTAKGIDIIARTVRGLNWSG
ncbi:MAG: valine--pyruvate transaminase [Verrucomicrobia bacterium]|nr:valine--pyruvate transaminase [Verrucomicrobiota bacterium]MCH8525662.1 valine--pyruvate transaminase [Kiritimatiellia bacterium]